MEIAPARGMSSGGKITLLPGQSPAEEFSTLAHELAHELLYRGNRRSATSRRIRETEAEATAFVVCHAIRLETGSAATDYIQLWNCDAQLLTESLAYIRQAASQMLAKSPLADASLATKNREPPIRSCYVKKTNIVFCSKIADRTAGNAG